MRILRFGETGFRLQDSTFSDIDEDQSAQQMGKIAKVLQNIK